MIDFISDSLFNAGIFCLLFAAFVFITDRLIASRGYKGGISDHFDAKHFYSIGMHTPDVPETKKGKGHAKIERPSVFKWMLSRKKNVWLKRAVTPQKPAARVDGKRIVVTFINHSTVLVQTEGLNIITDPIWAERASPFSFVGPRRYRAPGVAFDDLPHIDIVLLSHNHYDHLDIATLRDIQARFSPQIFVPLGVGSYLAKKKIPGAVELDWWQEKQLELGEKAGKHISVRSVPAQHFSARGLSDRNKSLWMGFVVSTPDGDIYFAGDTGYGPFVSYIADKYPKGFRLGLIPIGAFKPAWVMKEVHISPEEAYQVKKELSVKTAVAIHFGTFKLADDGQDEPVELLEEIKKKNNDSSFIALDHGGSIEIE